LKKVVTFQIKGTPVDEKQEFLNYEYDSYCVNLFFLLLCVLYYILKSNEIQIFEYYDE